VNPRTIHTPTSNEKQKAVFEKLARMARTAIDNGEIEIEDQ